MPMMTTKMQECIKNCLDCYSICVETLQHCLEKGGDHANPIHIRLLQDCVDICQTSAGFMLRGSERHVLTCGVCAEICERCARDCESMADDAQMKKCAEMCRKCAASCREMAASM